MMSTRSFTYVHPAIVFAAAVSLFFSACRGDGAREPRQQPASDAAGNDSLVLLLTAPDSTTVLDLTRRAHDVKSRSSVLGDFVTAIDGAENDMSAYWIYSVNDSFPDDAADKHLVGPGDTVRWHFRRTTPEP